MNLARIFAVTLFMMATPAHAYLGRLLALPPHASYKTLTTDHFEVIFPADYRFEARTAATFLEEAHALLSKHYKFTPDRRVTIVLADNQDQANGITSAIGHQGIVLFLSAPSPGSSIGEYDHWLRNLAIHEYSHYLTLSQGRGFYEFLRILFGHVLFPNHLWPNWLAEGIAVRAETQFTQSGRGANTYYSTLSRDAFYHDKFDDLLQLNQLGGSVPRFPFGESAYYAGFGIVSSMEELHGSDAVARFSEASSWRFPFLLNSTLRLSTGIDTSFQKLWSHWKEAEAKRLQPEIDSLRTDPRAILIDKQQLLTPEGTTAVSPRFSPDGKYLAYAYGSGHDIRSLHLYENQTGKDEELIPVAFAGGLTWSANGRGLYYSKHDFHSPYTLYGDLYYFDLESRSETQITHGARVREMDLCGPNTIVYTTQIGRKSYLKRITRYRSWGDAHEVLLESEDYHLFSHPRCAPDGTIYFSKHGTDSLDAIFAYTNAKEVVQITGGQTDGFGALFPEPVPNGFYFTQVKDQFYSIARWDAQTKQSTPVLRSSAGYWMPSFRRGPGASLLATSTLSATGIRLQVWNLDEINTPTSKHEPSGPVAARPADLHKIHPPPPALNTTAWRESEYNLLNSLPPRIWAPYLELETGRTAFGASIIGWDDTDQLSYQASAWFDTFSRGFDGTLATNHSLHGWDLGLSGSSQLSAYAQLSDGSRLFAREVLFTLQAARPFPGVFSLMVPAAFVEWGRTYRGGDFGSHAYDPSFRAGLSWHYDSMQGYAYSISSERGLALKAAIRRYWSGRDHATKALLQASPLARAPGFRHSTLQWNLFTAFTPEPSDSIPESLVGVGGRGTIKNYDLPLRGYPLGHFETRQAGVLQTEYSVPLAQVFRGPELWPVFLKNAALYGFYDVGVITNRGSRRFSPGLSGVGGGLFLNSVLGYFAPIQLRLEIAKGLRSDSGGETSVALSFKPNGDFL